MTAPPVDDGVAEVPALKVVVAAAAVSLAVDVLVLFELGGSVVVAWPPEDCCSLYTTIQLKSPSVYNVESVSRRTMYFMLPSLAVPACELVDAFFVRVFQEMFPLSGSEAEPPFSHSKFSLLLTTVEASGVALPKFVGYEVK